MTIYQDSKRIVGTNADRIGTPAISGGWKEVGRTTLGSANSNIDISSIPDKRYYMILTDIHGSSGTDNIHYRVGNGSYDSGTNYAYRYNTNGASESTSTSVNHIIGGAVPSIPAFTIYNVANLSAKEKLWVGSTTNTGTAGVANAPNRREFVSKWANTSNVIDQIRATTTVSSTWDSGSEVVVLGYDPDDTHTTNFWEELADTSGSGASFDTGTFTSKKYLWIQCWYKATGGGLNANLRVGNSSIDTGSNYAWRSSQNGAADSTGTTRDNIVLDSATTDSGETGFANIFVVNNASNEKLFIISQTSVVATGAGTAPNRRETVAKWTNTSNQINIVGLYDAGTGGSFTSSSFIKVWGSN